MLRSVSHTHHSWNHRLQHSLSPLLSPWTGVNMQVKQKETSSPGKRTPGGCLFLPKMCLPSGTWQTSHSRPAFKLPCEQDALILGENTEAVVLQGVESRSLARRKMSSPQL